MPLTLPELPVFPPPDPIPTLDELMIRALGTDAPGPPLRGASRFTADLTDQTGRGALRISGVAKNADEMERIVVRIGSAMLNLYGVGRGPMIVQVMALPEPGEPPVEFQGGEIPPDDQSSP